MKAAAVLKEESRKTLRPKRKGRADWLLLIYDIGFTMEKTQINWEGQIRTLFFEGQIGPCGSYSSFKNQKAPRQGYL